MNKDETYATRRLAKAADRAVDRENYQLKVIYYGNTNEFTELLAKDAINDVKIQIT